MSPSGTTASAQDCAIVRRKLERLLEAPETKLHLLKGEWSGSQHVEHPVLLIYTRTMRFKIAPQKPKNASALTDTIYALGPVLYSISVFELIPGTPSSSNFASESSKAPQISAAYGAGASGASYGSIILCGGAKRYHGREVMRKPQHRRFEARRGWILAVITGK